MDLASLTVFFLTTPKHPTYHGLLSRLSFFFTLIPSCVTGATVTFSVGTFLPLFHTPTPPLPTDDDDYGGNVNVLETSLFSKNISALLWCTGSFLRSSTL